MTRRVYLNQKPWEELQQLFVQRIKASKVKLATETVPVADALGRITAEPVRAKINSPHYHASAMDGIAVRSEDTFGASEATPITLPFKAAIPVNTGNPLPHGKDAVVMIEDVHETSEGYEIIKAVAPWENVRPVGEDIVKGEMILPPNHKIGPADIGALLASGVLQVQVKAVPRVGFIPSGSEITDLTQCLEKTELEPGEIVEFNSHVIKGLLRQWGCETTVYPVVEDDPDLIAAALTKAVAENDLVVINAGSSAGSKDYTADTIERLGELLAHGAAIKPGKPVMLGMIQDKPVIGLPGYPVSAIVAAELFLKAAVGALQGWNPPGYPTMDAQLTQRVVSNPGAEEFVRVRLGQVGDKVLATPIARGAGLIMSMVHADGMLRVPRLSQGYPAGAQVKVELFRKPEEIAQTIVLAGSHDLVLDELDSYLRGRFGDARLTVAPIGSLGGLLTLAKGEAHLAGAHLLDPETGEYNWPFIRKYLANLPVRVFNLVYRMQGFIVPPGNPKGITSFEDLKRADVTIVNRQRGAGTRILLDSKLAELEIDPGEVKGYEREEFTHTGVAVAVSAGVADVGLGIQAAAQNLGLDFIPVAEERYDLIIREEFLDTPKVQRVLEVLRDPVFQDLINSLPGYDARQMGEELYDSE
ncbi:MAG: molybdopterin biosynthesis protein [Firmicutes bacterium]|nr:molybdopterin biosynthesis protein [Bacillota bacterium]